MRERDRFRFFFLTTASLDFDFRYAGRCREFFHGFPRDGVVGFRFLFSRPKGRTKKEREREREREKKNGGISILRFFPSCRDCALGGSRVVPSSFSKHLNRVCVCVWIRCVDVCVIVPPRPGAHGAIEKKWVFTRTRHW